MALCFSSFSPYTEPHQTLFSVGWYWPFCSTHCVVFRHACAIRLPPWFAVAGKNLSYFAHYIWLVDSCTNNTQVPFTSAESMRLGALPAAVGSQTANSALSKRWNNVQLSSLLCLSLSIFLPFSQKWLKPFHIAILSHLSICSHHLLKNTYHASVILWTDCVF